MMMMICWIFWRANARAGGVIPATGVGKLVRACEAAFLRARFVGEGSGEGIEVGISTCPMDCVAVGDMLVVLLQADTARIEAAKRKRFRINILKLLQFPDHHWSNQIISINYKTMIKPP